MILTFQGVPEFPAQTNYQVPSDANHSPVQYDWRSSKLVFHDFFAPQPGEWKGEKVYFMRLILNDAKLKITGIYGCC
jgi:hypothetical protein